MIGNIDVFKIQKCCRKERLLELAFAGVVFLRICRRLHSCFGDFLFQSDGSWCCLVGTDSVFRRTALDNDIGVVSLVVLATSIFIDVELWTNSPHFVQQNLFEKCFEVLVCEQMITVREVRTDATRQAFQRTCLETWLLFRGIDTLQSCFKISKSDNLISVEHTKPQAVRASRSFS